MEVNLRFPLKRVLVIKDDDNPMLLSCEKLFEVCFYCGRIRMALQIRIKWLLIRSSSTDMAEGL